MQKYLKINIIDPSSTEFNRGSFCYAPYLCYNFLAPTNDVTLYESFQPEDLDLITDAAVQIVCLWSYPQIETATLLAQMLPFMYGKNNVFFVGYTPLIKQLGLPHIELTLGFDPLQDENSLKTAMLMYPVYYSHFKRLLLSDCDMHLKHLDKDEKVYPLFTSYGCPNGCAFCPSTTNCGKRRIELPLKDVFNMLIMCTKQEIKNIHFTDEDFFYDIDRAREILLYLNGKEMHLIALGSSDKVLAFIDKYGVDIIKNAGLEIIEIGFESGDAKVSQSMGQGKDLDDCENLAAIQHMLPFKIFWLLLTFFPGETIKSLNKTGEFMLENGFEMEEVVGRLRTNGTKGGLGQFFQRYEGTSIDNAANKKGMTLTERPIRLVPSYLPHSFLESVITEYSPNLLESAFPYLNLYNVTLPTKDIEIGMTVGDYIYGESTYVKTQMAITFAILARFGIIK